MHARYSLGFNKSNGGRQADTVQPRKRVICYSGHNLAHVGPGRGRFPGGHPGFPSIQGFREVPATPKSRDRTLTEKKERDTPFHSLSLSHLFPQFMLSQSRIGERDPLIPHRAIPKVRLSEIYYDFGRNLLRSRADPPRNFAFREKRRSLLLESIIYRRN